MILSDEILNIEMLLSNEEINTDSSLLYGNTGMALVYYLVAKHTRNKTFKEQGLTLLNNMTEDIETMQEVTYGKGLAGIGWCIEWLVQQGLLADTNTDEILSEADDVLYMSALYDSTQPISLLDGSTGLMAYFSKRFGSRNKDRNHVKNLFHQECLRLIISDISDQITADDNIFTIEPVNSNTLIDLGNMLYYLSMENKVNILTVENLIYKTVAFITTFLDRLCETRMLLPNPADGNYYINVLYLAASFEAASSNIKHEYWRHNAISYLESLQCLFEAREDLLSAADPFRKLTVYSLVYLAIPKNPVYKVIIRRLLDKCLENQLPFQIANGRGQVVLSMLCLASPNLIDNWFELFAIQY